jgi:hypothetical protein
MPARWPSLCFLALAGVSASGCALRAPLKPPADLAITQVHVVDLTAGVLLRDQTVLVTNGFITQVAAAGRGGPPQAALVVNGAGGYLIPGLWDMHAHIRGNGMPPWISTDWMMPLLLAHGVTGVRDMNSDCDRPADGPVCFAQMREWQEQIEDGALLAPRLLALSSIQVNPPWEYQVSEQEARAVVRAFHEMGVTNIKTYNRLSPKALVWMLDEASGLGMRGWGHIPNRMTAAEASAAGLRSIEHARDFLFDCYPGTQALRDTLRSTTVPPATMRRMINEHDPGLCAETFATLIRHDTWYVPTHVTRRRDALAGDSAFRHDPRSRYLFPLLQQDWLRHLDNMVTHDAAASGATLQDFYRKGLDLTGAAHRAGVRVLVGTDGGDAFSFPGSAVHDEMEELVRAGLTPLEALRAATLSAAEFLDLPDRYGSVAPGRRADLVLLDGNPLETVAHTRRIRAVFFGGYHLDRTRLDAMLADVERTAQRPLGPG